MNDASYRKALVTLRKHIKIVENNLRERDYSFDYSKQPSKAMFKYRKAFMRNDSERYSDFMSKVSSGEAKLNVKTLLPYEIITPFFNKNVDNEERKAINATWLSQEDFGGDEDTLVVVDGSGSMYSWVEPKPITVALSLGLYFAERNKGAFKNHFITFSEKPQLVEIKGEDLLDKFRYCCSFSEMANTNIEAVFNLILNTAVKNSLPASELPAKIVIVSDMEFDSCAENASLTNFQNAKRKFEAAGYKLPDVVFWNVASRNRQQPVTKNEQGVALVSGCTPRLFSMIASGTMNPYAFMLEVVESERYAKIVA